MDVYLVPLGILVVLAGIAFIPALILYAVPVRCTIAYAREPGHERSAVTLSWGPVAVSISRSDGDGTTRVLIRGRRIWCSTGPGVSPRATGRPVPPEPAVSVAEITGMVIPILGGAGAFFREFYRQCHLEGMTGTVRIGLGNPAATGMVFGAFWASRFALRASRIYLEVEPVFDRNTLSADVALRLRIRHPLVLIVSAVRFARIPAIRRSMFAVPGKAAGAGL